MITFQRPVFAPRLAQTTVISTPPTAPTTTVVAPPSASFMTGTPSGTDMITVLIVGGAILAALELTGTTHIVPWAKKSLGIKKK